MKKMTAKKRAPYVWRAPRNKEARINTIKAVLEHGPLSSATLVEKTNTGLAHVMNLLNQMIKDGEVVKIPPVYIPVSYRLADPAIEKDKPEAAHAVTLLNQMIKDGEVVKGPPEYIPVSYRLADPVGEAQ